MLLLYYQYKAEQIQRKSIDEENDESLEFHDQAEKDEILYTNDLKKYNFCLLLEIYQWTIKNLIYYLIYISNIMVILKNVCFK